MLSPLLTFLRWPLWLVELGTGAKSFADNPVIGSRRLNAAGLHRARVRLAHVMTNWRRKLLSRQLAPEDRDAFRQHGFVEWRNVLPPEAFARMRTAIMDQAWPARELVQGDAFTRRISVDGAMLRAVPELKALLRSPRWRGLLRYVAASRAEPHYYIQTVLAHRPGFQLEGQVDPQTSFHSDAFHPSMKAWLFLTDVAAEDGAFTYVPGSHRLTPERLDWEHRKACEADMLDGMSGRGSLRVGQDELAQFAFSPPRTFDVPANTLVVADTFGFHARGSASRPSIRVELWAYSRGNPFLPWTGMKLGSLPGIAHRRIRARWWLQDHFPRWAGKPITPVGDRRPCDP